jgi:hypothetical protein
VTVIRAPLAVVAAALAVAGCGGDEPSRAQAFTVTRDDGSAIELGPTVRAWCGTPSGQGDEPPQSLHVLQGDGVGTTPHLLLRASTELLETTDRIRIPRQPADSVSFSLFVNDTERDNEVADVPEGSEGTVEIERWGCDDGDEVTVAVDALLASEEGKGPIRVTGSVTVEIGEAPEAFEE